ncbi:hypothetical protein B9Z55_009092 [Caenorhabditis nigoni]|uniref:F-box domain-containing protein n=1 Tax=Caenorhabditis nigoni TaxID=1611254 RepID=A0A2G5UQM2_9PELO|nr:hypothetical protein B9Z55_009092 [Caenorhabditis nigoni]
MSRPLLYDIWPTVIERMDLANRILITQKCSALRRTEQRCRADANIIEITSTSLKINNTSFQVEKYESGEHAEVFKDTVNSKRVVLKTTVLLYEARMRLFKAIMKRRSGILNVKNLSILVDVNSPPNLKLCVQNLKVARPYCDLGELFREKERRTISLIVNLQKALTADSFPLESLEIDNNFSLVSSGVAKTVITTRSPYGIQNSNIHRVLIKNCTMISTRVADLIRNWQVSEPEVGRHYSMETGCFDSVVRYFSVAEQAPGAQVNATLASGMFQFGLTFPINQEKVLNVFMDNGKDENGMDKYVIHFKIDPNL